jgi:predicted RNase H-like HicB family nuclease
MKTKTKRTIKRQVNTGFKLTITAELTPDEEEGGYVVYCPELDIYTQGETIYA